MQVSYEDVQRADAPGPMPDVAAPSKTVLVFIELMPPLQILGLDRAYMRCNRSGNLKFALFILMWLGIYLSPLLAIVAGGVLLLWATLDWFRVMTNALSLSKRRLFCREGATWSSKRDVYTAFWLAVTFGLVQIGFLIAIIAAILSGPTEKYLEMFKYTGEKFLQGDAGGYTGETQRYDESSGEDGGGGAY